MLVVPVDLAAGWELAVEDRVVIVKEVQEDRVVVENSDGSTESIEILREDNTDNKDDLGGSEYEVEIEEGDE